MGSEGTAKSDPGEIIMHDWEENATSLGPCSLRVFQVNGMNPSGPDGTVLDIQRLRSSGARSNDIWLKVDVEGIREQSEELGQLSCIQVMSSRIPTLEDTATALTWEVP
jgi:hypothetical protein